MATLALCGVEHNEEQAIFCERHTRPTVGVALEQLGGMLRRQIEFVCAQNVGPQRFSVNPWIKLLERAQTQRRPRSL
ncbi:MAG: hypothetical protein A3E77_16710 [Sphingopyxis sp. RIFCSPHIGHO2_12_FULL_65_19]|nr:MAG: hypothetical protein A3E77_16710 [Sphingopyxis sp. RIFCSPHIGHO2_12_FULL_65_19]